MTIKGLLEELHSPEGLANFEKMTDVELLEYLRPQLAVVENLKPARKAKTVIDVSGVAEKAQKKAESVEDFIQRMMKMAASLET